MVATNETRVPRQQQQQQQYHQQHEQHDKTGPNQFYARVCSLKKIGSSEKHKRVEKPRFLSRWFIPIDSVE